MTTLAALDRANAASLEELRAAGSDAPSLLIDLLTNACMLELSKVATSKLDLEGLCIGAADILTQLAPIDRLAICVGTRDGRRVAQQRGFTAADIALMREPDAPHDALAQGNVVYRVLVRTDTVFSVLAAGGMPPELTRAGFFEDVASVLGPAVVDRVDDLVIVLDQPPEVR
jgi:hypothetical protein